MAVAKVHQSEILARWNMTQSPTALKRQKEVRRFEAAQNSRLNFGWTNTNTKIDADLRNDLTSLRGRSRNLSINNDYARKFLQMVQANVVGPAGFTLQSQVTDSSGASDTLARNAIETAFWNWGRVGQCETSGKLSFNDFCRLYIRTAANDGEVLVRRVRNQKFEFGYKLQIIDIDRLDILHNEELKNGNTVRMGVELDQYGAPVAYWLLTRHPGEYMAAGSGQAMRERVPATDIFHNFIADRPEQTRGFPWMAASMARMNMLGGYEEAAITAARNGASKMGFFTSPDGSAAGLADSQDDLGNFTTTAEPGTFDVIPQGYTFQQYNPEYPTQNYDSFVKSCLRGIASGLGVAYNALASDLEGVNFSSIRAGVLEERENWMVLQNWMIETFLRPMFMDWLESALLKGKCVMPNGSALPAGKLFKFTAHAWQGRRWQWVDPLKDIEASITAIRAGLSTPQIVAAQMGLDIEDVIDALRQANDLATAAGLPAYCTTELAPVAPPAPAADTNKELIAAILARSQDRSEAPAPSVNVRVGIDNQQMTEMAREITQVASDVMNQIREDVQNMPVVIPAPVVNVAAPNVSVNVDPTPVTLEATIQPADVHVTLPKRRTTTTVLRDADGNMDGSVAIEQDV